MPSMSTRTRPTPRKPPLSTTRIAGVKRSAEEAQLTSTPAPSTEQDPKIRYRSVPIRSYEAACEKRKTETQSMKEDLKSVEKEYMQTEMTGSATAAKEIVIRDEKRRREAEEVEGEKLKQLQLVEGVISQLCSEQETINREAIEKLCGREYLLLTANAQVEHMVNTTHDFDKLAVAEQETHEKYMKEKDECQVMTLEAKEKHTQAMTKNRVIATEIQQVEGQIQHFLKMADDLDAKNENAKTEIEEGKRALNLHEDGRRKLHNKIEELKGNIRVFCRIRAPLNSDRDVVEFDIENNRVLSMKGKERAGLATGNTKAEDYTFRYDHVFHPSVTQEGVFNQVEPLVQSCLDGFKVCIFAYGQTGSGKTYTMEGPADNKGVIPRAVNMIFQKVTKLTHERGFTCSLSCSFLEIYNDQIRDLLGKKTNEPLKLCGSDTEVQVEGLSEFQVDNQATVGELLSTAQSNRACASTKMNDQSSRSHSVFMLKIKTSDPVTGVTLNGVLNLIDLAGSEKVTQSEVQGQRFKEAVAINISLTHLGDVIHSLGTGGHVPFRNCILTRLLKNSLGGSSKCLMLVNTRYLLTNQAHPIQPLQRACRRNHQVAPLCEKSKFHEGGCRKAFARIDPTYIDR